MCGTSCKITFERYLSCNRVAFVIFGVKSMASYHVGLCSLNVACKSCNPGKYESVASNDAKTSILQIL